MFSKETQKQKVLRLLREAGKEGLSSYDLTYKHAIKQGPTRIFNLIEDGYLIRSVPFNGHSVKYILDSEIGVKRPAIKLKPQYKIVKDENGNDVAKIVGYI